MSDFADKAQRLGVPLIPRLAAPLTPEPQEVIAVCGECGLVIKQVMGYCCTNNRCPVTGLGWEPGVHV